jgi:hypothetical protein
VLAPEPAQPERVRVADDGTRGLGEGAAALDPALAEVAVLTPGPAHRLVEPAHLGERSRRDGEVVRGKERRAVRTAVVVSEGGIGDRLRGGGVAVARQPVLGAAAEQGAGRLGMPGQQRRRPAGLRLAVVVGEGEQRRARLSRAGVARRGRAACALLDQDLDPIGLCLGGERPQAGAQGLRPVEGRDDDAERRRPPAWVWVAHGR